MRILVVGAIQGGSNMQGKSLFRALKRQVPETEWLEFTDLQQAFFDQKDLPEGHVKKRDFLFALNARILEKVLSFRPDVVLGIAQAPMGDLEVLQAIKAAGIMLCYWFIEDYGLFTYWKDIAASFDHFFIFQKEPFFTQLKAIGCRNIHYLPPGFDSDIVVPKNVVQDIPVSFVGAPYPNRVSFFAEIAWPQFQIYGQHWNLCGNPSAVGGQQRVTEEECWHIYQRTQVNLNLHSSMDPKGFGQGDFINPRTYDLAGLGLFQLVDQRSLLPEFFDPVNEVPMFPNWAMYKEAIHYYLQHAGERKEIAANAQRRVLNEHTYEHRAREMLEIIKR